MANEIYNDMNYLLGDNTQHKDIWCYNIQH